MGRFSTVKVDGPPAVPMVKGGKVRALAVTGAVRSVELPDVPSMTEVGLPGVNTSLWSGFFAPAGTPEGVIKKANADLVRAVAIPEIAKRIEGIGWEERPLSPAETLAFIQGEQAKWAPIIKQIAETH